MGFLKSREGQLGILSMVMLIFQGTALSLTLRFSRYATSFGSAPISYQRRSAAALLLFTRIPCWQKPALGVKMQAMASIDMPDAHKGRPVCK